MSAVAEIRNRLDRDKAEFEGQQYPQYIRDMQYLLDLVEPQGHPAPVTGANMVGSAALQRAETGRRALDATGDVWFKLEDGRWSFKNLTTSSSQHLVQVFGPIRLLEETQ